MMTRWRPRPEWLTWWIEDAPTAQARLHRSALADYLTRKAQTMDIEGMKRGEVKTSTRPISRALGLPRTTIKRLLDSLTEFGPEADREADREADPPCRVISLYTPSLFEPRDAKVGPGSGPESVREADPINKDREEIVVIHKEDPELLPEEFTPEAEEFYSACLAIYRARVEVMGADHALPPKPKLKQTFDVYARKTWPRITDWKEIIAAFGNYWMTPARQKASKTFDYWRRLRNWCNTEEGRNDRKGSRPSGRLDPTTGKQRYVNK